MRQCDAHEACFVSQTSSTIKGKALSAIFPAAKQGTSGLETVGSALQGDGCLVDAISPNQVVENFHTLINS